MQYPGANRNHFSFQKKKKNGERIILRRKTTTKQTLYNEKLNMPRFGAGAINTLLEVLILSYRITSPLIKAPRSIRAGIRIYIFAHLTL